MASRMTRLGLMLAGAFLLSPAKAQEPFYAGKTISIVVGFGAGGGYDLYARLLSRYLGKHIPGKPTIVVQNMDGAGGVRAANHVYAVAPKDGTVIAGVNQGAAMFVVFGPTRPKRARRWKRCSAAAISRFRALTTKPRSGATQAPKRAPRA